jgi:RNA polymerase sigma-70 factor (ECF subfamily)
MATHTETDAEAAMAAYVETLFRGYRDPLLRYLTGLLPNSEDAAELLQETYLRLLRQEGLEHVEANARAYVFQIATNLVRDYFRQRKAHRTDRHISLEAHPGDPALQEPEAIVQQDDLLDRFKRVLMGLKPEVRDVFLLHRFRDMTYPEIGRALGLGTRTVERYMSEATANLRRALEWDI